MTTVKTTMSEVEEILINEIRSHPIIYNKFLPGYKKIVHREEEWKKIADTLNIDIEVCKRRWRTLRDAFIKNQRALENYKNGKTKTKKSKWMYYDQMLFLEPFVCSSNNNNNLNNSESDILPQEVFIEGQIITKNTNSNNNCELTTAVFEEIKNTIDDDDDELHNSTTITNDLDKIKTERNFTIIKRHDSMDSIDDLSIKNNYNSNNNVKRDDDADAQFLLSFLPTFKRLNPRQNAEARLKFQQIIFDIEFGNEIKNYSLS